MGYSQAVDVRAGWLLASAMVLVGCQSGPGPQVDSFPPPQGAGSADLYGGTDYAGTDAGGPEAVFTVPAGPVDGRVDMPVAGPGGTYTVQKGDTLWSIAARVYGNGQRHKDIAAANPQANPSRLLVGQTLVLP